jgi:hypothetical protein
MAQYINKSAVAAEIDSKKKCAQTLGDNAINSSMQQFYDGMKQGCVDILSFIDTLETKEVDIEKEVINWWNEYYGGIKKNYTFEGYTGHYMENFTIISLAKHFYELGRLKT